MRPIKFRVWDKLSKVIRYHAELCLHTILTNPDDFELMQFTGLKDKHGTEIWEGDVVVESITHDPYPETDVFEGVVEWDVNGWAISTADIDRPTRSPEVQLFESENGVEVEVLGNIYENPELLKQHETH